VNAVAETIEQSARHIGGHAWVELRLFEIVGGWVTTVPELEAKATLAAQSHHHAWHAELWHGLLPAIPHLRTVDLVAPPNDAVRALLEALAAPADEGTTIERLVGLYRVTLPALIAAYKGHLARTTPVTDGPTVRALHLVLADEEADREAGEDLLGGLVLGPAEAERAAARETQLRALLA
jgi:hypothetical protein